ncbi:hypothetical protein E4U17_005882 [Claviceps sp. LM77 group G4]|nr:hypothetical protein E4U17_005882 [Claviceps sp. LM77 group G4]KAG6064512.1 hypothetical protein E4U33_006102 [Claviceps sp. LM78 group G4]
MAAKRDLQDLDQGEPTEPVPKRAKRQTGAASHHQHQNSSIDPTWGQKYVFSSSNDASTIPRGQELDFEDDSDAMAYLLSVRKQAYDIPHLLVAPKVQIGPQLPATDPRNDGQENDDEGQVDPGIEAAPVAHTKEVMQGYYDDGAYIAMPDEDWEVGTEDGHADSRGEADARVENLCEAYHKSIMKKYERLRRLLHSPLPEGSAKRLSSSQITHATPFGRHSNSTKVWAKVLRNTDPHPLQLALMSKETVLQILRVLIGGTFLRRGHTVSERTSQWIWGLLARLPDRGELTHTDIGCIRDLGRHAVLLGVSIEDMALMRDTLSDEQLVGGKEGFDVGEHDENELSVEDVVERSSMVDEEKCRAVDTSTDADGEETRQEQDREEEEEEEEEEEGEVEEDGEVQEESLHGEDMAMDLDSGSEDGQVRDEDADLEAAKSGLLARLTHASDTEQPSEGDDGDEQREARMQLRINMRATLSMILTVAGECYGQRDLLEFRTPFLGL